MKNNIITLLNKEPRKQFSARQIAHHLDLPSAAHRELRHLLKELVRDGKIIVTRADRYYLRDERKALKGTIRINEKGYGFLIPENKGKTDVFIPARHILFAMNGDTVLVESFRNKSDGRYEGRVIQVLTRANSLLVGHLVQHGKQYFLKPIDRLAFFEVYLPTKSLNKAQVGDLVVVKIIQYPGPGVMAIGEVNHILGEETNDQTLTEAVLIKHGIGRHFGKSVLNEANALSPDADLSPDSRRVDLTHLPFITIDGVTARDFDDAVCVVKKGSVVILYVSIADVSHYVEPGSALDQEAYKRGNSTYLPNECIPMLPEKLSNHLCSLNPYEPRFTMTAEIHYNARYEFTKAVYYSSLIRSVKRATYGEVGAFFDKTGGEDFDPVVQQSLELAHKLAIKLVEQSRQRGALGFDLSEVEIVYNGHGGIQNIQKAQRFFSHKLIEMLMIAANVAVAQVFFAHGLPVLRRIHDKPDPFKVQEFLHLISHLGLGQHLKGFHPADFFDSIKSHRLESYLQFVFLRSLKQAIYDADDKGHYGLALKDYCHFTSPIRRYPDLIVHRQLKKLVEQTGNAKLVLTGNDLKNASSRSLKPFYSHRDLNMIGAHCSRTERGAMEAEREVVNMRRAVFMKQFVHEKFFGKITAITKRGMLVELDPYFVEGFLPARHMVDDVWQFDEKRIQFIGRRRRKTYHIGDRIWVTVEDVKVESADIVLALAEKLPVQTRQKPGYHRKR